ncbi:MAG: inositol monophosphatase family protein [Bacteroidota bacterium]
MSTQLDQQLQELLRETGRFIAEEFDKFSYDQVEYKGQNDPFTFVDVEAERRLRKGCEAIIPNAGFITEELENSEGSNEYRWIIDPIDGTSNFTHGLPHFCTALALQKNEETILGYVYQPISGEMFQAELGAGASLNGKAIQKSERQEMSMALASTGFPYAVKEWVQEYLEMVYRIMKHTHGLRRLGSAALDLSYVASGRLDIYFETGLKPWDAAAGALIVQEAGGKVSDFRGKNNFIFGRQIVATNGYVHEEVIKLIGQSRVLARINE